MNKVITIVILAAIGLGVWKFWPDIMGKVKEAQNDDEKTEENKSDQPPEGGNTPVPPPVGPNLPIPPVGGNTPIPPPPVGGNTDPLGVNVPPENRQKCEVLLEAIVGPDLTGSSLFIEVKVASPAKVDIVECRMSGKDLDTGWKQLTFTPTGFRGGVTTHPQEMLIEIRIDPNNQAPPAKQLIGANGELLDGPFVREEGQRQIVYASTKLRPSKLKFSARNPNLKLALAGAADDKKTP